MNYKLNIKKSLVRLWAHLDKKRRLQFLIVLFFMFIASVTEAISIGAILPLLTALTSPDTFLKYPFVIEIIKKIGSSIHVNPIFLFTAAFLCLIIFSAIFRLLMLWISTHFSFATGADLSINAYRRTLYQPYGIHCRRNSSEIIDAISAKINAVIYNIILPSLVILSSILILTNVIVVFVLTNEKSIFLLMGGFTLVYVAIAYSARARLLINSKLMAKESTYVIKSLQESIGGIRDIIIDQNQEVYCKTYQRADRVLRKAQANSAFIGACPRYFLEALAIVSIVLFTYFLMQGSSNEFSHAIPLLGMLAFGAQRILPILQQTFSAWSSIQATQISLEEVLNLLDQPLNKNYQNDFKRMPFKKNITLTKIDFYYELNQYVLKNLNLKIERGSRTGFIGETGSGKSTLIDILMGLLVQKSGSIKIDGKILKESHINSWQKNIAHVPQNIFLTDGSIEENIALGISIDNIDYNKLHKVTRQAQLFDYIQKLPLKYETRIGERGVRLSGGQRQRIGIARALYKEASIIIFDEATSSLDSRTEAQVMQSIYNLGRELTILIISHRISSLKNCSKIYQLFDCGIKPLKNFKEALKE